MSKDISMDRDYQRRANSAMVEDSRRAKQGTREAYRTGGLGAHLNTAQADKDRTLQDSTREAMRRQRAGKRRSGKSR